MTAIDKLSFAEQSMQQALYLGVNVHYLVGVAQLRSGIDDGSVGTEIGPFRLLQLEWDENRTDADYQFDFLSTDISNWRMQCSVFALMTLKTLNAQLGALGRMPSAMELYLAQWPAAPQTTLAGDFQAALDATAPQVIQAAANILGQPAVPSPVISNPTVPPPAGPASSTSLAQFNAGAIPNGNQGLSMAGLIVNQFGEAGFGKFQQAAALANAIAESNLNPNAHAGGAEDSWGLFQLNRNGGLGTPYSSAQLIDPSTNIQIIISEVRKYPLFAAATTISDAVSVFVQKVERPANPSGEIVRRLKIAQSLLA